MHEMVSIPRDECLRLGSSDKDLTDLRRSTEVLDRIISGEEELVPEAVVTRLLNGEAPLAVWRENRQLSRPELARRSDVNRVQIIDIETGRNTGSVATLRKLAMTLEVDLDDLVALPQG